MKCLVIGGGFGGLSAITGLRKKDKQVEIVLIEPKQFFEVVWASYRSVFDKKTAEGSLFHLPAFCTAKNVTHIQSSVTSLTAQQATLANGDTVDFDVAVVAVGAGYPWKGAGRTPPEERQVSPTDRQAEMTQEGQTLMDANKVLIVGGGLIGVELAGDLAFHKKEASKPVNVTVVHSGNRLCSEMSEKASTMALKKLEKMGVKVILNDKAVETRDGVYTLQNSNQELSVDTVAMTVGLSPMNSFLEESMLNEKGWVLVDDYFRIQGSGGKLFSVGDCCTLLGNSGVPVLSNIAILGANLKATLDALEAKKEDLEGITLKKHKNPAPAYVATVGKKGGVFFTPGVTTQRFVPGIKNSTMFFMTPKSKLGIKNVTKK